MAMKNISNATKKILPYVFIDLLAVDWDMALLKSILGNIISNRQSEYSICTSIKYSAHQINKEHIEYL